MGKRTEVRTRKDGVVQGYTVGSDADPEAAGKRGQAASTAANIGADMSGALAPDPVQTFTPKETGMRATTGIGRGSFEYRASMTIDGWEVPRSSGVTVDGAVTMKLARVKTLPEGMSPQRDGAWTAEEQARYEAEPMTEKWVVDHNYNNFKRSDGKALTDKQQRALIEELEAVLPKPTAQDKRDAVSSWVAKEEDRTQRSFDEAMKTVDHEVQRGLDAIPDHAPDTAPGPAIDPTGTFTAKEPSVGFRNGTFQYSNTVTVEGWDAPGSKDVTVEGPIHFKWGMTKPLPEGMQPASVKPWTPEERERYDAEPMVEAWVYDHGSSYVRRSDGKDLTQKQQKAVIEQAQAHLPAVLSKAGRKQAIAKHAERGRETAQRDYDREMQSTRSQVEDIL